MSESSNFLPVDKAKERAHTAIMTSTPTDTDHCIACGSDDLFSGFYGTDDLASDGTQSADRWTTFCNHCGAEQP